MITLDDIVKARNIALNTMGSQRKFGSFDTEPRRVLLREIEKVATNPVEYVWTDKSADEWELYTASMDCGAAAKNINAAVRMYVDLYQKYLLENAERDETNLMLDELVQHTYI